jgi:hypothetical protein
LNGATAFVEARTPAVTLPEARRPEVPEGDFMDTRRDDVSVAVRKPLRDPVPKNVRHSIPEGTFDSTCGASLDAVCNAALHREPDAVPDATKIGWSPFEKKYGFSREREAAVWFAAFKIWKEAQ